jgi:hypothetical protein
MPHSRTIFCSTVIAALALLACVSASPALARSNGCHGLHLSTAKHRVQAGGWVRVRGRVCHGRKASSHVRIAMRGPHGWRVAVKARVHSSGRFTRRVRVGRAVKVGVVHLHALQRAHHSNAVAVKLGSTPAPAPAGACSLTEQPGEVVEMTLPGCPVIASDTSSDPNPIPFWGAIECENSSRYSYDSSGGDTHLTASGAAQPDGAYRTMTTIDGDDTWGERCELGKNDNRTGPTVFYREGQHRVTFISMRLPSNFPLSTNSWQTVMQMKQTQPSNDDCCGPEIEMEARSGKWVVVDSWHELFSFPARSNTWTRFAWDVYYSQDPAKGWIQVSADLNGDGDFNDPGERSPVIHTATLRTEPAPAAGAADVGLPAGAPIPSHLRAGIYHDPSIPCPAPSGCSVEVDNVQVVGS